MIISPEQCRAARALLSWNQQDLADRARVAKQTIADFERGARTPYDRTLRDICSALEQGGVILITATDGMGVGVRLAASD